MKRRGELAWHGRWFHNDQTVLRGLCDLRACGSEKLCHLRDFVSQSLLSVICWEIEGFLVTVGDGCRKLGGHGQEMRNRGYQPSSSASSHAAFSSRHARVKSKMGPKGGSVHQKRLLTRCFDCNGFGHWSGDAICPAKDKHDAQAHITSCTVKETVHVHLESFVTSSIAVEQELRGAGACDACCNRTVAGQEWMNDDVHSL